MRVTRHVPLAAHVQMFPKSVQLLEMGVELGSHILVPTTHTHDLAHTYLTRGALMWMPYAPSLNSEEVTLHSIAVVPVGGAMSKNCTAFAIHRYLVQL